MREQEFAKLFSRYALYYNKSWTDDEIAIISRMYFESLKQFDVNQLLVAFKKHAESHINGTYFPKICELVAILSPEKKCRSELAWASVERAINQVGVRRGIKLCFDDEITMRVLDDFGGFYSVMCDGRGRHWVANDFKKRYDAYAENSNVQRWPAYFLTCRTYDYDDIESWQLLLIGDEAAARRVHERAQHATKSLPVASELANRLKAVK